MSEFERLQEPSRIDPIRGWFSLHDAAVFHWILSSQIENNKKSGIFEIGVFEGKSASFLSRYVQTHEAFIVCDIFDLDTDELNNAENSRSYAGLALETFQSNMRKFGKAQPQVLIENSLNLRSDDFETKFRFIHVDGSHLFDQVENDLSFALKIVDTTCGVIAIDDFRAQHTPGVAAAVWKKIIQNELVPIILTETKMYCVAKGSEFQIGGILPYLQKLKIAFEIESFLTLEVLRIYGLSEEDIFDNFSFNKIIKFKGAFRQVTPPILWKLFKFLRKL